MKSIGYLFIFFIITPFVSCKRKKPVNPSQWNLSVVLNPMSPTFSNFAGTAYTWNNEFYLIRNSYPNNLFLYRVGDNGNLITSRTLIPHFNIKISPSFTNNFVTIVGKDTTNNDSTSIFFYSLRSNNSKPLVVPLSRFDAATDS